VTSDERRRVTNIVDMNDLHATLAALVIFFEKFLVRACDRAITAIRAYGTTGTYVVCYTGRSTTDDVRIIGKTVLDPSGICYFV
jgi:hypothetical protein